jgi:protein TonB
MSKIDLTTLEWRELIFQDKNKNYGAYVLRKESGKRHNISIIIVAVVALIGFSIPKLIELAKSVQHESVTEVTTLSKLEKAEVKQDLKKPISLEPPPEVKSSIKFVAPVIKKDEDVNEENEIKSQDELNESKVAISIADVKGNNEESGMDIADVKTAITQVEEEQIFDVIEQMPTFPGGEDELFKYINNNVKYPVIAQENGVQGRVIVKFVVTKNGDVDRIEVVRSIDSSLDREAIRVVKNMPRWIPGKQNGENVSVWFTLPINFSLQN